MDTHSVHVDALAARGLCRGTPADFDKVLAGATIVVTVRHPDAENEHHTFGNPVTGIDIDLGSSFDVTKIGPDDWEQVLGWAACLYAEADDLPKTAAGLEARAFIRSVAEETLAQCLPYDSDGGCSVSHHIYAEHRKLHGGA